MLETKVYFVWYVSHPPISRTSSPRTPREICRTLSELTSFKIVVSYGDDWELVQPGSITYHMRGLPGIHLSAYSPHPWWNFSSKNCHRIDSKPTRWFWMAFWRVFAILSRASFSPFCLISRISTNQLLIPRSSQICAHLFLTSIARAPPIAVRCPLWFIAAFARR